MQYSETELTILTLLLSIMICVGFGVFLKRKNTMIRISKMRDRRKCNIESLIDNISDGLIVNKAIAESELMNIAQALNVPVGLLRPDDVLEYLIGEDYFVGDAILEIEMRLNSLLDQGIDKPTIREIILAFSCESQSQ